MTKRKNKVLRNISKVPMTELEFRHNREQHRRAKRSEVNKTYRSDPDNFARIKRNALQRRYGLTDADYLALIDEQDRCPICGVEFDQNVKPHIDHDHATGKVRGLLCNNCNTGLGMFKDNSEFLLKAIEYLKSRQSVADKRQ
jgi:hypothetical protein